MSRILGSNLLVLLLIYFILTKEGVQSENSDLLKIFKCSPQVRDNFLEIPTSLQSVLHQPTESVMKEDRSMSHDDDEDLGEELEEALPPNFKFELTLDSGQNHSCKKGYQIMEKEELFELRITNNYSEPHTAKTKILIFSKFYWSHEGTLKIFRDGLDQPDQFLHSKSYCIAKITPEYIKVKACIPACTTSASNVICLPKCCAPSQAVSLRKKNGSPKCAEIMEPEWKPLVKRQIGPNSFENTSLQVTPIHYTHVRIQCENSKPKQIMIANPGADIGHRGLIQILENGRVLSREAPYGRNYLWKEEDQKRKPFCLDRFHDLEGYYSEEDDLDGSMVLITCGPAEASPTLSYVYLSFFIVSTIFALLTLIVYALLWDKHNVHGWTVAVFSFCMLFFLIFSACSHGTGLFQEQNLIVPRSSSCVTIGVMFHFFYVAMFSWLTVLCFDLWSTIRVLAPCDSGSQGCRKLVYYGLFGFGVPTVVICVSVAIEISYKDSQDISVFRPLYGFYFCSLDKTSLLYYATLVIMLLYMANVIFAFLVGKTLWEYKRQTESVSKSNSKASASQAGLYIKLFFIMGITWIFEFISWFAASEDIEWYWSVWDCINILQAVGIFWIFVCKKDIKEQLAQKYRIFKTGFAWIDGKVGARLGRRETVIGSTVETKSYSQFESEGGIKLEQRV